VSEAVDVRSAQVLVSGCVLECLVQVFPSRLYSVTSGTGPVIFLATGGEGGAADSEQQKE
jgi:hypothetical protein